MSTSIIPSPGNLTAPVYAAKIAPAPVTFLMCPPKLYDVSYVINPWMAGHVHDSSRTIATEQWQHLYNAVTEIAEVVLVEPEPGSPDMVFTANAGLERDGVVLLSSFFHKERQGEQQHFRRWFDEAGYTVLTVPHETPFEGEGDALFAVDGSRLWAGYGPRTLRSSHHYLSEAWKIEVTPLHLIDPRFYHLDTCFAPLEDGSVMYYPPAFDEASIERIEACYAVDQRIIVTEADALRFACNVITIDGAVILNEISRELSRQLQRRGFQVIEVALSEFLKAGGAAKCLVMRLDGATHHPVP
jgi:N-dimethylarginine dimethylaminohydrolase